MLSEEAGQRLVHAARETVTNEGDRVRKCVARKALRLDGRQAALLWLPPPALVVKAFKALKGLGPHRGQLGAAVLPYVYFAADRVARV